MIWSWWNKNLTHEATVNQNASVVFNKLLEYYKNVITNGSLVDDPDEMKINYNRGSAFFSACGLGTELWTKHYVNITLKEVSDGITSISWDINMKLFGLQAGKNAITEECKKITKEIV